MDEMKNVNDPEEPMENGSEDKFDTPYGNIDIFAWNAPKVDVDKILENAGRVCMEKEIGTRLVVMTIDPEDDKDSFIVGLDGASSRGVIVQKRKRHSKKSADLRVEIPDIASPMDVALAFEILKAVKKVCPDCYFLCFDNEDEGRIDPDEESYNDVCEECLRNFRHLIQQNDADGYMGVQGMYRPFFLPKPSENPDMEINELTCAAMQAFIDVQWKWKDMAEAYSSEFSDPEQGDFRVVSLANNQDVFVPACRFFLLHKGNEVKQVQREDFVEAVSDTDCYEAVDRLQFVLRVMPEEEWNAIWDRLEGQVEVIPEPNTFIMRWNPEISSYTLEDYRRDRKGRLEGFYNNWSVWDWQQAHDGDRYVMMRVDGKNPGIVWYGDFVSDPYEGSNWRGKGNPVHYVDIACLKPSAPTRRPILTLEELTEAIPEVDWLHGHSGEILAPEFAERLWRLLDSRIQR